MNKSNQKILQDPVLPDQLVSALLTAMPSAKVPKKREAILKKNLLAKIATMTKQAAEINAATNAEDKGITTARIGAGRWHPQQPGIDVQVLCDDGHHMTWLARFAAGARLAPHKHRGTEESSVLQGSCYAGKILLNQGDYQLAIDGSEHGEVYSPEGCILLIRSLSLKVLKTINPKEAGQLRL